ncbi:hypothetical protein ABVE93_002620 [Acinetobacter baumannii]
MSEQNLLIEVTDEQVNLMGDYGIDKLKYLELFKHYQDEDSNPPKEMWRFINQYEQHVFHFAEHLTEGKYRGGYWKMEKGFFVLQGGQDTKFNLKGSWGQEYELNIIEFSIVVNLFALSHLSCWAYGKGLEFINNLAVFFSDFVKDTMKNNAETLKTDEIYALID